MGGMFQPTAFYNVGSSPHDMAVGDFNQDGSKGGGLKDIANSHYGSSTVSVLMGNGDGTFYKPACFL
ncbi:MAG: hypothetical protein MRQ05_02620 [Candidatus Midichloria mitochondrii]|uniref:Uncharacterized protein n=1 Tax=Midichloria mitochondrii (strain IricVA) TaxID=696127 RepID=F7XVC2_MIDMI|nr:hypothetical protein [Candidatus Midichloria mitochondrii]AEI88621.1 hypothetical protein midi_00311 [Candidatus Midichloria mitochondrii IricVA]MDJ1256229.1 hypothetical protein [Candidatus Midichloria mitochondrii]MDJ1313004.1 hypothetical protein [Candidatus Midichloria mitochondrii]